MEGSHARPELYAPRATGQSRTPSLSRRERSEHLISSVLVGLGERRIVEHHLDEDVDRATELNHRLPDVHELGRALADHVHADQLAIPRVDDELRDALDVALDLAARILTIERSAHHEVDALL